MYRNFKLWPFVQIFSSDSFRWTKCIRFKIHYWKHRVRNIGIGGTGTNDLKRSWCRRNQSWSKINPLSPIIDILLLLHSSSPSSQVSEAENPLNLIMSLKLSWCIIKSTSKNDPCSKGTILLISRLVLPILQFCFDRIVIQEITLLIV